ncbi:GAF domain-containing protein [Variovorax ginsengisoli]|uniref:GAF domain-containing protein n=1 Tax=Variovorax ginsengisoli TaxID=363844 RepID=A0ABT9S3Y4_9BURK|nr:GAF domain-containing protein [Variovorax ginsengisoli]MDP9899050.1 GAF domain-containing protein [Variovorax ginsengisoli]
MPLTSRLQKERALNAAGIVVRPLPSAPMVLATGEQIWPERTPMQLSTEWEREVDRLYQQMVEAQSQPPTGAVQRFVETCRKDGLSEALTALNQQVRHRYTAVYAIDGETMKNIVLVDKAGEDIPAHLAQVPMGLSFCQYVLRDGVFLSNDSTTDVRLHGHPSQSVVVAYHAVPIIDDAGAVFGSLSHFDLRAQPLSDIEFTHLQGIARVIYPFARDWQAQKKAPVPEKKQGL